MHTKALATVTSILLVAAGVVPAAAAGLAVTQQAESYTGTHVTFEATDTGVVDYSVDNRVLVESIAVQDTGRLGAGLGLSAVTSLPGAAVSMQSSTETSATMTAESGARMEANDNGRGILVIRASGTSHYVTANLSGDSQATQAGDKRVVVTKTDGTQGTFIVVGEGRVTVNDEGNVTAKLGDNGRLVYRQYDGQRSASEKQQEQLIANGTAAAEVYVLPSDDDSSDTTTNVVNYSDDTTVEVTETSTNRVNMTVERTQHDGRVIITSVSNRTFDSTEDIQVAVDGEAAARADSYADLVQATKGGAQSKYLVQQSSTGASATSEVVVGINHFSTRTVTMTSGDGGTATETPIDGDGADGDTGTTGTVPGFGLVAALAALVALGASLYNRSKP